VPLALDPLVHASMNDASMHSEAHENNQLLVPLALTHVTRCYKGGTLSHRENSWHEGHVGSNRGTRWQQGTRHTRTEGAHGHTAFPNTISDIRMAKKQREE